MNKLLTVSIAAYNVEKYLAQTLLPMLSNEQITDRLFSAMEIIIVDDGSTDHTLKLANQYAEEYPQIIKVISKENGGHGSTINTGIREATGKYFKALDGDDWFDEQGFVYVLQCLEKADVDMIITDYTKCYEDGRRVFEQVEGMNGLIERKEYLFDEIIDQIPWIPYHAAIYKTGILQKNNIQIDEKSFYVDTEFMLYPIPYIQSIMYLKSCLYCYRLGVDGQSVSRESRKKNIADARKVSNALLLKYQEREKSLSTGKRKYLVRGIGGHCVWYYRSLLLFCANKKIKDEISIFDNEILTISKDIYSYMERKSRLVYWMRKSSYRLYTLICFYRQHKREN